MKTVKSHNLSHNFPVLHSFNTQLHYSYTLILLHSYTLTLLHSYILPILHSSNLRLFQSYTHSSFLTLPILHSSNPTLPPSSSSSCRCSPPLVCRSPPPPQSQLVLGLGAAVSRGRGVPGLCPHLANFHLECQVWAQLGHTLPLLTAAPRPSTSWD